MLFFDKDRVKNVYLPYFFGLIEGQYFGKVVTWHMSQTSYKVFLINQRTEHMQLSPYWEAYSRSAGQEFTRLL
jgi:hypothetical protein